MSSSPPPTTNDILQETLPPAKIGVVICSQRQPRIGNQIGTLIFDNLKQYQQANQHTPPDFKPYELSLVDLADHPLPLFNEPGIPQSITNPLEYTHEHTRAWSQVITSHKAFIFVTPQYNWGYPANLKNAIDYLFNEWVGKPAMVVSYGGHGGNRCAEQLKQVLSGVRMKVVQKSVGLAFPGPGREFLIKAAKGEDLGLANADGPWAKELEEVKGVFDELVKLLHEE
ncbi:uncharacterized protein Z520_00965 [Fonsecaea multimorphosa CBS 102226]|uniref:NADPH-dependent FMN reductase-like domain-containing protein n=1 Tax=Fonsecaea multimorphosa CBS 102226 TaxID=1442371 RepID=A0A0D2KGD6_9EURO|nr:uncharacterized protein Z520_00965 [Fonsecaea multimorphosa CBS 102226]KIY02500.1 hypothetical protein Z520_00965 [Fonsecaea multimorphosa CBS 102226]OAL31368.1 hypothetical protein AYO22_00960 [Fonsecaea multimorphosa]